MLIWARHDRLSSPNSDWTLELHQIYSGSVAVELVGTKAQLSRIKILKFRAPLRRNLDGTLPQLLTTETLD